MQTLPIDRPEPVTLSVSLDETIDDTLDSDTWPRDPGLLEAAGATHPGCVRENNEDAHGLFRDLGLVAVADGLGGRNGGEIASRLAIQGAREVLEGRADDGALADSAAGRRDPEALAAVLREAMERANGAVHLAAQVDPRLAGMGTTLVAALFTEDHVAIAHVGDSRCYRVRGGVAERLTVDHSMREMYLRVFQGRAKADVAERNASILTRAVGVKPQVQPDVRVEPLRDGDAFLLCTDGVWGLVSDDEIAAAVTGSPSLDAAIAKLFAAVYSRGAPDNLTAVIVRPRRRALALSRA